MNSMEFNYQMPGIPMELLVPPGLNDPEFIGECERLWKEVVQEILDAEHVTRSHHNVGTYDRGCRGPLCRKAYREHPKRRVPMDIGTLTPRAERVFDPIMEYFHTVMKHRVRQLQLQVRGA